MRSRYWVSVVTTQPETFPPGEQSFPSLFWPHSALAASESVHLPVALWDLLCVASLMEHLILTVHSRVSRRGTSSFFPRPQSCSVLWTGPVWHVCPSLMSTWLVSISGCYERLCGCLSPCFHSSGCSPGRGLPSRRVILCVTLRNN